MKADPNFNLEHAFPHMVVRYIIQSGHHYSLTTTEVAKLRFCYVMFKHGVSIQIHNMTPEFSERYQWQQHSHLLLLEPEVSPVNLKVKA